jgi:hypothetical protein
MLESDLPATPVPESQMAAAVAGVGFSGEVDVVPAVVLAPDDAEHARALAAIQASFDAAEAAESDRRAAAGSYEARTVGAELATVHLAVTSLHRVGAGGDRSLYAFEARRTYAAQQGSFPDECDQVTIMTGWLAGNVSDALTVIPGASAVELTNCDRKGVAVVEPLGAAVVDGRTFVVVVNHGYEGESYSIQDVSPAEVRETIIVHGGGC